MLLIVDIQYMISSNLYKERGRWIIMKSQYPDFDSEVFLDILKGILVFRPRITNSIFRIYRVDYCNFKKRWFLYFICRGSGILKNIQRFSIPSLGGNELVRQHRILGSSVYYKMNYKIVNYSNMDLHDEVENKDILDRSERSSIGIDLSKIKEIYRNFRKRL